MKIKTIDVNALEWFDRVNGNSYFAGTVTVNYGTKTERSFNIPFQYGYGEQYLQEALSLLKEKRIIPDNCNRPLWAFCQDSGIILRTSKYENCKKRELLNI